MVMERFLGTIGRLDLRGTANLECKTAIVLVLSRMDRSEPKASVCR